MEHTRFIGLDIHKERISIAVAENGLAVTAFIANSQALAIGATWWCRR